MTCPQCGNDEHFVQRVVEVRDYHFSASEDFQCKSAWSEEWDGEVDRGESEFQETRRVIGIFCDECGQLVVSGGQKGRNP